MIMLDNCSSWGGQLSTVGTVVHCRDSKTVNKYTNCSNINRNKYNATVLAVWKAGEMPTMAVHKETEEI